MVVDIHVDDDSVELANLWHNLSFCCFLAANLRKVSDIIILFAGKVKIKLREAVVESPAWGPPESLFRLYLYQIP